MLVPMSFNLLETLNPMYLVVVLGLVLLVTLLTLHYLKPNPRRRFASESKYSHHSSSTLEKLETLFEDRDLVDLSVVIPAFNESSRITCMLDEALEHLQRSFKKSFEIIIVDDGSTDNTTEYAVEYAKKHALSKSEFRVLTLAKNRGKGGAVTQGMLHSRGKMILFADADGASKFKDVDKLLKAVSRESGSAVAIGSRSHLVNTSAVVKRSALRNFLMHSFHKILFVLGIGDIADTQCGFKLFTRDAARIIFTQMHVEGWIFDVEVLLIAKHFQMPIAEIPISWHEIQGSKINVLKDSISMLKDLLIIRLCYFFKMWSLSSNSKYLRDLYMNSEQSE